MDESKKVMDLKSLDDIQRSEESMCVCSNNNTYLGCKKCEDYQKQQ